MGAVRAGKVHVEEHISLGSSSLLAFKLRESPRSCSPAGSST